MKRQLLMSLPVVALVACLLITGCAATTPVSPHSTAASASTITSLLSSADASNTTVTIKYFSFQPSTLTVKKGTMVTWVNEEGLSLSLLELKIDVSEGHTVTSIDGRFPSSGLLNKGDTYQVQFNTTGSYSYYCAPHPWMMAKINVVE